MLTLVKQLTVKKNNEHTQKELINVLISANNVDPDQSPTRIYTILVFIQFLFTMIQTKFSSSHYVSQHTIWLQISKKINNKI